MRIFRQLSHQIIELCWYLINWIKLHKSVKLFTMKNVNIVHSWSLTFHVSVERGKEGNVSVERGKEGRFYNVIFRSDARWVWVAFLPSFDGFSNFRWFFSLCKQKRIVFLSSWDHMPWISLCIAQCTLQRRMSGTVK